MKIANILAVGALALTSVVGAKADVDIRIAGSSAYRKAVHQAIYSILGTPTVSYADGTTLAGANAAIFTGTTTSAIGSYIPSGTVVTIRTSWTGSVAGLYSLANTATTSRGFLPIGVTATGTSDYAGLAKAYITDTASTVDIALTDVKAATGASIIGASFTGLSTGTTVGICPFKWVVSGTSTGINDISAQQIRALYGNGYLKNKRPFTRGTTVYTGAEATVTGTVYAFGRDTDSGTRLTAFAEAGLGAAYSAKQYGVLTSGSYDYTNGTIGLTPASTVNGVAYGVGRGGIASGGDLAKELKRVDALGAAAIAYLSVSDANNTALTGANHGTELTYNGVPFSAANVINGTYTFWSYENLYYRTADASKPARSFADSLANQLTTTTVPALYSSDQSYIPVSAMGVTRSSDGGTVLLK